MFKLQPPDICFFYDETRNIKMNKEIQYIIKWIKLIRFTEKIKNDITHPYITHNQSVLLCAFQNMIVLNKLPQDLHQYRNVHNSLRYFEVTIHEEQEHLSDKKTLLEINKIIEELLAINDKYIKELEQKNLKSGVSAVKHIDQQNQVKKKVIKNKKTSLQK